MFLFFMGFAALYTIGMAVTACVYTMIAKWAPRAAADAMFSHCDDDWSDQRCRNELMDWIDVVVITWWLTIIIVLLMICRVVLFKLFSVIQRICQWAFGPVIVRLARIARKFSGADPK